jgi:hypothetical protein
MVCVCREDGMQLATERKALVLARFDAKGWTGVDDSNLLTTAVHYLSEKHYDLRFAADMWCGVFVHHWDPETDEDTAYLSVECDRVEDGLIAVLEHFLDTEALGT